MTSGGVAREASAAPDARLSQYDWARLSTDLSLHGCAGMEGLMSQEECRQVAAMYPEDGRFRSHVDMARPGFGKREYRYFNYPLPNLLGALPPATHPPLAQMAHDGNERLRW